MESKITVQNQIINYSVRVSLRAKRPRISVSRSQAVTVTLPQGLVFFNAENFLLQKINWVLKSLDYFKRFAGVPLIKRSRKDYLLNRQRALLLARQKIEYWNQFYGFSYGRVTIKNQKTRWGSCSKKGNLNFNYRIVHLPEPLLDYLIVHELCHLKELNHGRGFWDLVNKTIPGFKKARRELRLIGN